MSAVGPRAAGELPRSACLCFGGSESPIWNSLFVAPAAAVSNLLVGFPKFQASRRSRDLASSCTADLFASYTTVTMAALASALAAAAAMRLWGLRSLSEDPVLAQLFGNDLYVTGAAEHHAHY